MTPRQVRSVLAVMELGSVQRAAKHLHLAPSSISAQIRELSNELGVTLFESYGRGLMPSDAAQQLQASFSAFRSLDEEIRQLAQSLNTVASGLLKLYAPSSLCIYRLPAIIEALQHSAPNVELVLIHEPFDYQTALQQAEIDAALSVTEARGEFWQYTPLYTEEVIYVTHPDRYCPQTLTLADLAQTSLITTEPGCTYRVRAEQHFRHHGLQLKPRQSFANVEVIKRCLWANMGIALLPRCVVADDLVAGRLKQQAVVETPYRFYSQLIYSKKRSISPKLQALIQVVRNLSKQNAT